ncbi:hypothetical protein HBE96_25395 [Clostridium sp. P21]|uniref:Uncharacterized protein n=1 Tax=Clostridium muellerianum TaxID=2716538 RepID=A0A7Y0EM50_9CLOT|nr:hypothetical protein [Clostridium muellerianum]NMM65916.1 hypothetical protein [Clostridium muellerianum]
MNVELEDLEIGDFIDKEKQTRLVWYRNYTNLAGIFIISKGNIYSIPIFKLAFF